MNYLQQYYANLSVYSMIDELMINRNYPVEKLNASQ